MSAALRAAALPSRRVEVGMARVPPLAAVRLNPAAVLKLAAVIGSSRKIGWLETELSRQADSARQIKPCNMEG